MADTRAPYRPGIAGLLRWRGPLLWLALLLAFAGLGRQLYIVVLQWQDAQHIEQLRQGHDVPVSLDARAPVLFARAAFLVHHLQLDEATLITETLVNRATTPDAQRLSSDALYNLANGRLRQGITWLEQGRLERAGQALRLARDNYVRALRAYPDHWPARYNLDITSRMVRQLPRQELEGGDDEAQPEKPEDLWTEVRGIPRGLP